LTDGVDVLVLVGTSSTLQLLTKVNVAIISHSR
jgi:hypothetical protein